MTVSAFNVVAPFPVAVEPLIPEFDALLRRLLQVGEHVNLQRTTNEGEALVITSHRVIVFKSGKLSGTGAAQGRYFPIFDLQRIDERKPFLRSAAIVFVTMVTVREAIPWRMATCSFAVTFKERSLLRKINQFLSSVMLWVEKQRGVYVATGALPAIAPPTGTIARRGERFFFAVAAAVFEEQSARVYKGGTQGVSFRILPGVYYRIGGNRARATTETSVNRTDTGVLSLSDQRVLFVGPLRTLDIPLSKIAAVAPFKDGVQVNLVNGKVTRFETGESNAARFLERLCTNPPP